MFHTYSASSNRNAWKRISDKMPHADVHGCVCHILNFLIGDIKKLHVVKNVVEIVESVVNTVLNHQYTRAKLNQSGNRSLKSTVTTRWLSLETSLRSLIENKDDLKKLAIDDEVKKEVRHLLFGTVLQDDFWTKVTHIHSLIAEISHFIKYLESDASKMSEVFPVFQKIKQYLVTLPNTTVFSTYKDDLPQIYKNRREMAIHKIHLVAHDLDQPLADIAIRILTAPPSSATTFSKSTTKRREMAIHRTHLAAHVIDPTDNRKLLSQEESDEALNFIIEKGTHWTNHSSKTLWDNKGHFYASNGPFSSQHTWTYVDDAMNMTSNTWWNTFFYSQPLAEIVSRLLTAPPSSASCEKSFSVQKISTLCSVIGF
ncbi:hypothetical protein DMENIID0001_140770 [Sergentomyia squamirostris]